MIKEIIGGIWISLLLAKAATAMVIDAPHNEAVSGIRCGSCHTYSLWWKYSPARPDGSPTRGEIGTTVCLQCHNTPDGPIPYKQAHSSSSFGATAQHGQWSTNCTDCHNPHFQAQLDWLGSNSNELYLVTGTIGAAEAFVVHANNTTTFTYTTTDTDPLWTDPATWTNKTGQGRSLILVDNTQQAANTYSIVAADANTITVKGGLTATSAGHTFGLIYGQLIKSAIATPHGGTRPVKFFDPKKTFAVGGFTEPSLPEPQGICQVCHTATNYWRHDGQEADPLAEKRHNQAIACTACHTVASGFKPSGGPHPFLGETPFCMTCHPSGDILAVHNNNCQNCHTTPPTLADPASKPLVITIERGACQDCHGARAHDSETVHDHRKTVASCAACHAVATAAAIDTLHKQTCGTCHGYNGAKLNATVVAAAIATGKGTNGLEVNCQTCHLPDAGLHPTEVAGIAPWHDHFLADSACASCHDIDSAEKRLQLHPSCFTCHTSSKEAVTAAINAGRAGTEVHCSTCHGTEAGSAMVHGTTPATVAPLHDAFVTDDFCAGCHDLDTPEKRIVLHPDCSTCHSSSKVVVLQTIHLGRSGTVVDCAACHTGGDGAFSHGATPATVAAVHDQFAATERCATCHTIASAEQRIALHPACTTCHTSTLQPVVETIAAGRTGTTVACGDCHGADKSHDSAAVHDQRLTVASCAACHAVATAAAVDLLHQQVCGTCHGYNGSKLNPTVVADAIAAGKGGTEVNCQTCHLPGAGLHPTDVAGIAPWHDSFKADDTCAACHDIDTPEQRLELHPGCLTCHTSTKETVVAAISAGRSGTEVRCSTCHSNDTGSAMVHGTTPATVAPLHDAFAGDSACGGCHASYTAEQRLELHPGCLTCHAATKEAVVAAISAGKAGTEVRCSTCHSGETGSAMVHGTTPATVAPLHDAFVTDDFCAGCHDLDTPEKRIVLHPDCLTCHTSNKEAVVTAISAGKAGTEVRCSTCHSGEAGSAMVHGTTPATVAPLHDAFAGDDACGGCHHSDTAQQRLELHPSCLTCHTSTKETVVAGISAGKAGQEVRCSTCHNGGSEGAMSHPTEVAGIAPWHEHFKADAACAGCHDTDTAEERLELHPNCHTCHTSPKEVVVAAISAGRSGTEVECGTCHSSDTGSAMVHGTTTDTVAPLHDAFNADSTCADCHDIDTVEQRLDMHPNCLTCHSSTKAAVVETIRLGRSGTAVHCSGCHTGGDGAISHGTTPATAAAVHNKFAATETCARCHTIGSAEQRIALHPTCTTCHLSTKEAVEATIATGQSGTPVACADCHGTELPALHHASANAASGNCTWCHADPRPNWSAQAPGDNGGSSPVPTQLACATCHVRISGDTVYIDKLSYANDGSPVTRTLQHTIPGVSAGYIYNYGMCFSCHDGVKAPLVRVFHAKPQAASGPRFDLMAGAPGKGTFNLFWGEFHLDQEIRGKDYLKKLRQAYFFPQRAELYQQRDYYRSHHTKENLEKRVVLWQKRDALRQKRDQFKQHRITYLREHQRDYQFPATGYDYRLAIPCGSWNECTGAATVPVLPAKPVPR